MLTLRPHTLLSLVLSLLLVAGSGVSADSVDIFAVDYAIVAYIVASKDALTTYAIACTAGADPTSCNFAQPYTLIEGPSTVQFQFTAPTGTTTQSLTLACDLQGTTSMGCTATGNVNPVTPTSNSALITTTQSFTYTGSQATSFFSAVPLVTNPSLLLTYTPGSSSTSTTSHVDGTANATGGSASVTPGNVTATSTKASSNETVKASSMPAPSGTPKNILVSGATYRLTGNGAFGMGILVAGAVLAGLF